MTYARRVAVQDSADRAASELHGILRQRAGLVREHVLHHAQVTVHVRRASQRRGVRGGVIHSHVVVDVVRLHVVAQLHGDVEGDGQEVVVQYEEGEPVTRVVEILLGGAVPPVHGVDRVPVVVTQVVEVVVIVVLPYDIANK